MKQLNRILSTLLATLYLGITASFASDLPACPTSGTFNNCFGSHTFENRDKYVGEWKDDELHGQGTYTFANGNKHVGEFKYGNAHGMGTATYVGGDVYVGEYKDGKKNGQGTYSYSNGQKYVGGFKNGNSHGMGTHSWPDGTKYVGEYKDGKKNGLGTTTFGPKSAWAGAEYIGEFKDGKENGKGFYIFSDGKADFCTYTSGKTSNCSGTNVHNVAPVLKAAFTSLDKDNREVIQHILKDEGIYNSTVDGLWSRNTFTAIAEFAVHRMKTIEFNRRDLVDEIFVEIEQAGLGEETEPTQNNNNDIANNSASSLSDLPACPTSGYFNNCYGSYTFDDGNKYLGEWKEDDLHGQGTYTFTNGDKYIGEYKNSKRNGQGTYSFADGTKEEGFWKDDEFLYASQSTPKEPENNSIANNIDPNEILNVASGTGFYVSGEGHIVTNHHVINGCGEVKVHAEGKSTTATILAEDASNDLALLKISNKPPHVFAFSNESPYPLQNIIVAGFPFGDEVSSSLKFTTGVISSLAGIGDNYSQMQIDAAIQPGNSGGPIIDELGNVVGVAVSKLDVDKVYEDFGVIPENTNFGIKGSVVKTLLQSNDVELKSPNTGELPKSQLSKITTKGTLHLSCWMTVAQIEKMHSQKVLFENFD